MNVDRHQRLDRAIVAARAGHHAIAGELLRGLLAEDPTDAEAWLWLSGVVHDPAEQWAALQHAVTLEPDNIHAQRGLQWLQERHPELASPTPSSVSVAAPPAVYGSSAAADTRPVDALPVEDTPLPEVSSRDEQMQSVAPVVAAPEPTQAMESGAWAYDAPATAGRIDPVLETGSVAQATDRMPIPTQANGESDLLFAPVDEELRCPVCGTPAGATDLRCSQCGNALLVPVENGIVARLARFCLALVWLLAAIASIVGSVWLLGGYRAGSEWLAGGYRGLEAGARQALASVEALGMPRGMLGEAISAAGWSLAGVALLGLLMAVGLFRRWRAVYLLQILLVLAVLVGAIVLLIPNPPMTERVFELGTVNDTSGRSLVAGVLAGALLFLALTLAALREFFPRRVRVRIPVQWLAGPEHFRLGTRYRDRGWHWAAARELERAVEEEPHVLKYRRTLADVYSSMGNQARARHELRASFNLEPDTSPVGRAGAMVEEVQRERQ